MKCCFLVFFIVIVALPVRAQNLAISTGEYPPWTSQKIAGGGAINKMVRAAFELKGYKVSFEYFPWARSLKLAKQNSVDATSYWAYSDEYKEDFLISDPIIWQKVVFFYHVRKPLDDWATYRDLSDFRIGTTLGHTYPPSFIHEGKRGLLTIEQAGSSESNFEKLMYQRIGLYPMETIAALDMLRHNFPISRVSSISYHPKPLMSVSGHLLISRKSPQAEVLLDDFNAGLKEVSKSGKIEQYYQEMLKDIYKDLSPEMTLP